MDSIEPTALYDERGDVSWTRPLLQGDVFDGVVLPGFGDEPMKVQIVAHPCAMRVGVDLAARVTVAPVVPHQQVIGGAWDRFLRIMPLAELASTKHFATKFVDVTAAPATMLTFGNRIASLSSRGIWTLQQRLAKHYTRVEMPLELLRRSSAAVLLETELHQVWLEEVLTEAEQSDIAAIEAEARVFDEWLGQRDEPDAPTRRERLGQDIHHADIRRDTQRAAERRADERGSES